MDNNTTSKGGLLGFDERPIPHPDAAHLGTAVPGRREGTADYAAHRRQRRQPKAPAAPPAETPAHSAAPEPRPTPALEPVHSRYRSTRSGWRALLSGQSRGTYFAHAEPGQAPGATAVSAEELAAIRPHFDRDYYLSTYQDVAAVWKDPLEHFLRFGWREGRNPSASFNTRDYVKAHPEIALQGVNPLWHYAVACKAKESGRARHAPGSVEEAIAPYFDPDLYRQLYPDIVDSNLDPIEHYVQFGWREGRNPGRGFDTRYYLDSNPDVAEQGINPLWHYAVIGKEEGRRPVNTEHFQRTLLRSLKSPDEKTAGFALTDSVSVLGRDTLLGLLQQKLPAATFVLSVSHDAYIRVVGGTQIFIADEQARFTRAGAVYVHVSPMVPRLRLAGPADGALYLRLIVDGADIGCIDAELLAGVLDTLMPQLPAARLLVCHCLLGHRTGDIVRLHAALRPQRAVYWLHDYSSLCEGLNLLRNDVTYCGAPAPDSQACRICIYGSGRARHLAQMQEAFSRIAFDIAAPSETALRIWETRSNLPGRSRHVLPHATIDFTAVRRSLAGLPERGTREFPVRVAFAGHPMAHKGWPAFLALVRECAWTQRYRFYHFTADPTPPDAPVESVRVQVTSRNRDGMRAALEANSIDLVLLLSNWPETFSYVTYEAIASGADVVTVADSGNVAAEVTRSGRGIVLADFSGLTEFFASGRAVDYVRLCYEQGNQSGQLVHCGTTAALWPVLTGSDVTGPDETSLGDAPGSAAGGDALVPADEPAP